MFFVVALPCLLCGEEISGAPTRKSIYFELLGPGLLYSVNYDNNFSSSYVGRIGLSVYPKSKADTVKGGSVFFLPLTGSYLIRKSEHQKYEIGAGAVIITETWKDINGKLKSMTSVLGTITLYWCYSPKSKGIYYRLGVTPLFGKDIGDPSSPNFLVTGGAAIGYSF